MNPFAALGLSADADEAQIKRAYAKRLRANRPDDDPAGFQRLNEAYRHCLESARRRAAAAAAAAVEAAGNGGEGENEGDDDGDGDTAQRLRMPPAPRPAPIPLARTHGPTAPPAPPGPVPSPPAAPLKPFAASAPNAPAAPVPPAPSAPRPRPRPGRTPGPAPTTRAAELPPVATPAREAEFDAERFLDELHGRAETDSAAELERWLARHPALYRFERKHALAPTLVAYLGTRAPLHLPQLDALLRFFGLDSVHAHSTGLQARIVELRARARRSGADLSEVRFGSQRGRGQPGLFPEGGLSVKTVVFLILSLGVIGAMLEFLLGPGKP